MSTTELGQRDFAAASLCAASRDSIAHFRVMRTPLLRGRSFGESDGERTAPVVIVSAATARCWPDEDPVGKRIRVVWDDHWRTVVGVVGDVRQSPAPPTARSARMPP